VVEQVRARKASRKALAKAFAVVVGTIEVIAATKPALAVVGGSIVQEAEAKVFPGVAGKPTEAPEDTDIVEDSIAVAQASAKWFAPNTGESTGNKGSNCALNIGLLKVKLAGMVLIPDISSLPVVKLDTASAKFSAQEVSLTLGKALNVLSQVATGSNISPPNEFQICFYPYLKLYSLFCILFG
jgi:hypothetical protein